MKSPSVTITDAELVTVAMRILEAEPGTPWAQALKMAEALIVWSRRP